MEKLVTLILINTRLFAQIMIDMYSTKLLFEVFIKLDEYIEFIAFDPEGKIFKKYTVPYHELFYNKRDNYSLESIKLCFYNFSFKQDKGYFRLLKKGSELHLRLTVSDDSTNPFCKEIKLVRRDLDDMNYKHSIYLDIPDNLFNSKNIPESTKLFEFKLTTPLMDNIKKAPVDLVEFYSPKMSKNKRVLSKR